MGGKSCKWQVIVICIPIQLTITCPYVMYMWHILSYSAKYLRIAQDWTCALSPGLVSTQQRTSFQQFFETRIRKPKRRQGISQDISKQNSDAMWCLFSRPDRLLSFASAHKQWHFCRSQTWLENLKRGTQVPENWCENVRDRESGRPRLFEIQRARMGQPGLQMDAYLCKNLTNSQR